MSSVHVRGPDGPQGAALLLPLDHLEGPLAIPPRPESRTLSSTKAAGVGELLVEVGARGRRDVEDGAAGAAGRLVEGSRGCRRPVGGIRT